MKKNTYKKIVGVYWNDIRVYDDGGIHTPSSMYTEGVLQDSDTKQFLCIVDPETLLISDNTKNHPQKKPKVYAIPRSLIEKVVYYE